MAPVLLFVFSLCFHQFSLSFRFVPFQKDAAISASAPKASADLISLLHLDNLERDEVYSEAIRLLDSMQSSSSCHQNAVSNLLSSCQLLEGRPNAMEQDSSLPLEDIKSLYAARLALCELSGAGATLPDKCVPILNFQLDDTHSHSYSRKPDFHGRQKVVPNQLEACLHLLESRPQWWTSYSNNRQNAAVMCQAARFDIERDDLLKHHRKLAEITFGLSATLNQSLTDAAAEASRQHVFLNTVNNVRLEVLRGLKDADIFARNQFTSLAKDIQERMLKNEALAHASLKHVVSDAGMLSEDIISSIGLIQELKEKVKIVHRETLNKSSELARVEHERQKSNSKAALAVQQLLNDIQDRSMVLINQQFGQLQTSLWSLNEMVAFMHQKQNSLDERVASFDKAFQQFELKAAILQDLLMVQISNHSRFQESLYSDLRVTQSLLNEVTGSAANLGLTLEESAQNLNEILNLGGLLGSRSWKIWGILLLFALFLQPPRIVVVFIFIFAATAGSLPHEPFKFLLDIDWSSFHQITHIFGSSINGLVIGVTFVMSTVASVLLLFYLARMKLARITERKKPEYPDLP